MNGYVQEILTYGSLLLTVALIVAIAAICYYLLHKSLLNLSKRGQLSPASLRLTKNTITSLIFIFALLLILQQLGIQVSSIISSLLAISAMVAVGFIAVWSILSNLLCSLLLIIFRPFQIGDEIEITEAYGGTSLRGKVIKFNVMYTTLLEMREAEQFETSVPNNIFFQKAIRKRQGNSTHEV